MTPAHNSNIPQHFIQIYECDLYCSSFCLHLVSEWFETVRYILLSGSLTAITETGGFKTTVKDRVCAKSVIFHNQNILNHNKY